MLSELDEVILQGLRSGRIVQLPNGTHYQPYGKKDGSITVKIHLNKRIKGQIAAASRAKWLNSDNIDKSEAELIALWNALHPDDPIEE